MWYFLIRNFILNTFIIDLKPDNIGFDSNGVLKLFDFGLAKVLDRTKKSDAGLYHLTGNTVCIKEICPGCDYHMWYAHTNCDCLFCFALLLLIHRCLLIFKGSLRYMVNFRRVLYRQNQVSLLVPFPFLSFHLPMLCSYHFFFCITCYCS